MTKYIERPEFSLQQSVHENNGNPLWLKLAILFGPISFLVLLVLGLLTLTGNAPSVGPFLVLISIGIVIQIVIVPLFLPVLLYIWFKRMFEGKITTGLLKFGICYGAICTMFTVFNLDTVIRIFQKGVRL